MRQSARAARWSSPESVSKYSTVTVGGNPASLDASNKFRGTASVTAGTNNVPVIATDVDGNASTNTYQVVVPSGGSVTNSYDYNGNLLTDGTRNFAWDAKNELVSIVYTAGSNNGNHTEFTYNGLGQRVKIVERTGATVGTGTITSTKQFVWEGGSIAEERDASNVTTKRFFAQGEQRISGGTPTNYFYTRDHLGSIREMIASNGTTISARYSYDPYGRATKVSGSLDCDFQYAGYYEHATSGLNLTMFRAYNPNTGTWISRDPSGEGSGLNLYAYCADSPIDNVDPSGLFSMGPDLTAITAITQAIVGPLGTPGFGGGNSGSSCVDSPPMNPLDPNNPGDSPWNAFWKGFTDPNALQQSAAATANGATLGLTNFPIQPGNQYGQDWSEFISMGATFLVGVALTIMIISPPNTLPPPPPMYPPPRLLPPPEPLPPNVIPGPWPGSG